MVHHLIDPINFFFFKIHNADLFQSTFAQVWLNQQPFPEILIICYFRALWWCQGWRCSSVFIVKFFQNHKGNYGALCKPKNCTSMQQFFSDSKKPDFIDISCFSPINKIFSWLYHFFILKKSKIYMKFHKNSINCFWEKLVLTTWLTGWQWCFHKTHLCLKTKVQQYQ